MSQIVSSHEGDQCSVDTAGPQDVLAIMPPIDSAWRLPTLIRSHLSRPTSAGLRDCIGNKDVMPRPHGTWGREKVIAHEAHGKSLGRLMSLEASEACAEAKYQKTRRRHCCAWKGRVRIGLLILCLLGAVVSLVLLLPNKPESGNWLHFGPRETMMVVDYPNAVFLVISRLTAYMMYPCMVLVFTAKAHCLRTWLFETQLRLYFPFLERLHDIHVRAGWLCFWLTYVHAVFHVVRWARLGHLHFLYENQTGLTGLIGWICCTLVTLPMGLGPLRRRIRFEIRKTIHTVGGLGFGICGTLHAPATNIMIVYGLTVLVYLLDWIYANLGKTYEVKTCHFTRLQNSVVLHWENPKGWDYAQHGYVNICIPFVRRYEWHAISIYPHSDLANTSSMCIAKAGDWSNKLHSVTLWKTTRPVWIQGPFLTPFASSVEFDNAICVSSGSGISASLAALQALKSHRRVSLIWLCRDASMVEFYLNTFSFDEEAYTLIYYTGKQKLRATRNLPPTVLVFTNRPDLRSLVCMIISSIETEDCLPESLVQESEDVENGMNEYAWTLSDSKMSMTEDPMEQLHSLLGRSLEHYRLDEIIEMLQGPRDDLSPKDMQIILARVVPMANFSHKCLDKMAAAFDNGAGNGIVSRQKMIDHVKEVMDAHHGKDSGTTPEVVAGTEDADDDKPGHRISQAEARNMLSKHGGSRHLKEFIATLNDEDAKQRLSRWAVLYCGGSKPVSTALKTTCSDFNIKYDQEKFDW